MTQGKVWLGQRESSVVESVLRARKAILDIRPVNNGEGQQEALRAIFKPDGSLVTIADELSQEILLRDLNILYPKVDILSEENPASFYVDNGRRWIIDPLDGTRDYHAGGSDFAILASLLDCDTYELSLVDFAAYDELYVAFGSEAREWRTGRKLPLVMCAADKISIYGIYCDISWLGQLDDLNVEYIATSMESTRALLEVAKGSIHAAVIRMCGHKSWDIAALVHLVTAAQAYVSDQSGARVSFSGIEINATYLVAARDKRLHQLILSKLSSTAISE